MITFGAGGGREEQMENGKGNTPAPRITSCQGVSVPSSLLLSCVLLAFNCPYYYFASLIICYLGAKLPARLP